MRTYFKLRLGLPGLPREKNFVALLTFIDWGGGDSATEIQVRTTVGHTNYVFSAVSRPGEKRLFDYREFQEWIKAAYKP